MREVIISKSKMTVIVDSVLVEFTKREFDLLYFFVNNQGNAFTRKQIIDAVWEHEHVISRGVDVAAGKVRKKINDIKVKTTVGSDNFTFLQTVPHMGYRLSKKISIKIDDDLTKKKQVSTSSENVIVINGSYQDNKKNTVVVTNIADSKFGRLVVFVSGGSCIAMAVKDFKLIYKSL
jgi:DNA-binding winged helix-turn-helix (wHTH) protein